ncbi:MAG: hypothetical protein KatS3mg053_2913 [Candidatus Roseilinea sp.]|nr:MAG: hypothetical protein KatS3mg053_2913 [Candidatus Roseilinea sp.]
MLNPSIYYHCPISSSTSPLASAILSPILAGRVDELAALRRWIEGARDEAGVTILISGEAGIGKSRLLRECIQMSDFSKKSDMLVLQGNCYEQDRALPFAPFVDLLRRIDIGLLGEVPHLDQLLKLAPDLAAQFPDIQPAPIAEPEQEKHNLFRAWMSLLSGPKGLGRLLGSLLLIIEDLHWCDDVSLELLLQLARAAVSQPLALVLTYRSDEVNASLSRLLAQIDRERLAREITLKPLPAPDVESMMRGIFQQTNPISRDFLETICARTEGNPFFVEEVLRTMVESGDIFQFNGRWTRRQTSELHVPRTVRVAMSQRVERLNAGARQALLTAAVIGQRFNAALLQSLTGMDERQLNAGLHELMDAQLVVENTADEFAFRHALTREATYAMLLKRERRELHRAVGEVLEAECAQTLIERDAELSYHLFEGEAWVKAMTYAHRAGEKAQAVFAPREAIVHFSRAIEAAQKLPSPEEEWQRMGSLHRARAQAYETLGEFDRARSDFETALTQAQSTLDNRAEWENLFSLGFLWTSRDMQTAGDYLDRALTKARTLDQPATLAASLNRVGNWRLNMEQSDAALTLHREALSIFVTLSDEAGQALTNDLLGIANMLRGDFIASVQYHDTAIALFRKLNQPMNLSSTLGTAALRGGCYQSDVCTFPQASADECWQLGSEAIQLAKEIEWRGGEANANAFLALAMGSRGAYARSLICARDALDIALDIDNPVWGGVANICMGKTHHDCLSFEMARVHLADAVAAGRRVGAAEFLRMGISFLASTLIALGKLDQARNLLDELPNRAPAEAQTTSQHLAHAVRAELLLAERNAQDALALVEAMRAALPHLQSNTSARLGLLRGEALVMLNRPIEAEQALLAAAQAAAEQTLRPLEWRIHVALGRLYRRLRRRDEAQAQFDSARTIVCGLADELDDKAIRAALLSGFDAMLPDAPTITPLRAAKQAFDGLTAREREVAALVAQGRTNKAIAEQLVVSERTVEKHVENAMGKLGFTSRSQLAVWAAEKLKIEN